MESTEEDEEADKNINHSLNQITGSPVGSDASLGGPKLDPIIDLKHSVSTGSLTQLPEKFGSLHCASPASSSVHSRRSSTSEKLAGDIAARAGSYSSLPRNEDAGSVASSPVVSAKRRKMKLVRIESTTDGMKPNPSDAPKDSTISALQAPEIEGLLAATIVAEVSEALKVSMDVSDEEYGNRISSPSESPVREENEEVIVPAGIQHIVLTNTYFATSLVRMVS